MNTIKTTLVIAALMVGALPGLAQQERAASTGGGLIKLMWENAQYSAAFSVQK